MDCGVGIPTMKADGAANVRPVIAPRYAAKRPAVLPNMEGEKRLKGACSLAWRGACRLFIQHYFPAKSGKRSSPVSALKSVRPLDQVRERIRYVHYSIRSADADVHWIKAFIRFHDRRHPRPRAAP